MDRGAWQAAVHGATKSQTRLNMHTCTHARTHWEIYPVLIVWASKSAPFKNKMIYTSSKEAIKKKSTYIKCEVT